MPPRRSASPQNHRGSRGTCHDPVSETNSLQLCMNRWMDMYVCIHPRGSHGCLAFGASTDLGSGPAIRKRHPRRAGAPVTCVCALPLDRSQAGPAWERGGACPDSQCLRVLADRPPARTARPARERQTAGFPTAVPGGANHLQVGPWMPSSPVRRANEQPRCDLSCGPRHDGVAVRALSPCSGVQAPMGSSQGVIPCRFPGPGDGGSDTKTTTSARGFATPASAREGLGHDETDGGPASLATGGKRARRAPAGKSRRGGQAMPSVARSDRHRGGQRGRYGPDQLVTCGHPGHDACLRQPRR